MRLQIVNIAFVLSGNVEIAGKVTAYMFNLNEPKEKVSFFAYFLYDYLAFCFIRCNFAANYELCIKNKKLCQ